MAENGAWIPERAAVFDIAGPLAMFRKPYSPLSPVSFPLPPPTAVFGVVGAILGLNKDDYLRRLCPDSGEVAVGVRVLKPVQKLRATLNLLNTKTADSLWRIKAGGGRIQIPHEYLKDVAYRIYFGHDDAGVVDEIADRLSRDEAVYTPCLGRSECIADVVWRGVWSVEPWEPSAGARIELHSALPADAVQIHYERGVAYGRFRVPARMKPDRTVTRYNEVVVRSDSGPIQCTATRVFRCSSDEEGNGDAILFL